MRLLIILICYVSTSCHRIAEKKTIIYSPRVKDSFELFINLPTPLDSTEKYNVFYYCDANLKSGKKLRELINKQEYSEKVNHTIFVGIGHIGNFHILRQRDFILPLSNGKSEDDSNYGKIENFYQFMKLELVPKINATYNTSPDNNSILGHSLGGLYVFYTLF